MFRLEHILNCHVPERHGGGDRVFLAAAMRKGGMGCKIAVYNKTRGVVPETVNDVGP